MKIQSIINLKFSFFLFFVLFLFIFAINKVFALEVSYPHLTQSPVNITSSTKLPEYAIYLFYAGMSIGFFSVFMSLIISGAMYFLSPVSTNSDFLNRAKDRAAGAISGLLILSLTYLIITTISPQLSIFKLDELSQLKPLPEDKKEAGVYFYKTPACQGTIGPSIAPIPDLADKKNEIRSVGYVQDGETAFVAIIYDKIKFNGKCQYINPNKSCNEVNSFAASASIYQYDFSPNGDGVYLFRKSFFSGTGGFHKIKNSDIRGIYIGKLSDLVLEDKSCKTKDNPSGCCVPLEERDCIKYDKNGLCPPENRVCPNAGGENISSIGIAGNYFVLLVYFAPEDKPEGPWTACQAFPASDDINKLGPHQIKWEPIKNNEGVVPNYIVIIPVQQKW